jgi:hypothetical protein
MDFQKIFRISDFKKIRPMGSELFHADVRTDIKLLVAFRSFANASEWYNVAWKVIVIRQKVIIVIIGLIKAI